MIYELNYKGLDVVIKTPPRIEGKYTIRIGNLVTAYPIVKKFKNGRYRVFWMREYGKRFTKLLRGAFRQYFWETSV